MWTLSFPYVSTREGHVFSPVCLSKSRTGVLSYGAPKSCPMLQWALSAPNPVSLATQEGPIRKDPLLPPEEPAKKEADSSALFPPPVCSIGSDETREAVLCFT